MPSLLLISFVEWSGAFQRPQHLAVGLARRGWDVTYASPGYLHRRSRAVSPGFELPPSLRVIEPPALPGARFLRSIERFNRWSMTRRLNSLGPWDAIVFNDPRWSDLAARLPAPLRVFDNMDDLSAHAPGQDFADRTTERALEVADRVWTGTASLADRLSGACESVRFIPCGVDGPHFAEPTEANRQRAAADIASAFGTADTPLAGYFGMINERLDAPLLSALASRGWRVLLIGPDSSQRPHWPSDSSIRWIGPRPYAELPGYLAAMDLALIPYRTDGPNRFLYPVKALEYLAGGRPVLSTPLPDVVRFLKDYVHLAATPDEWSRVAENWTQLKPQLADKARLGQTYALNRGWSAMIDEMCEDLPRP